MNNFIRNILLLAAVLILSYFTAGYFGGIYDQFSPQYGNSFLGIGRNTSIFIAGLPFAYVFFATSIFMSFGFGSKKKWTIWLLIPALLFWLFADIQHIYIPILLALVALGLALLIRKILKINS